MNRHCLSSFDLTIIRKKIYIFKLFFSKSYTYICNTFGNIKLFSYYCIHIKRDYMNNFVETQSQIIRVRHSNNFTQISNDFLRNKSLSMKSKGLLCTILSLPDEWIIKKTTLHQFSSDGIEGTMNAFNELIDAGYIIVLKTRNKGKFNYKYIVCDIPLRKNHNGLTTSDNTQQINTELVNTGIINTQELKTTASAVVSIDSIVSIDSLEEYMKSQLITE